MKKLNNQELYVFCNNMNILLSSGYEVNKTLNLLYNQFDKNLKVLTEKLIDLINNGKNLSESFEELNIFSSYFLSVIKCGESSGKICESFENLALLYKDEQECLSKIRKSLVYPSFIVFSTLLSLIFIIFNIVPNYEYFFEQSNMQTPENIKDLLEFSKFFRENYFYITILVLGFAFFVYLIKDKINLKQFIDHIKITLFKSIFLNQAIMRFSSSFEVLLKSGLNFVEAINLSVNVVDNNFLSNKLEKSKELIKQGQSLSYSINECNVFPKDVITIIKIGEESGNLENSFQTIKNLYSEKFTSKLDIILKGIGPSLIVLSAIFVGYFMITITSSMYDYMNYI